jgi:hypothetical protein
VEVLHDVSKQAQTVVFEHDLASWGWVWPVVGIVLVAAGFAVISGAQWARWVVYALAAYGGRQAPETPASVWAAS